MAEFTKYKWRFYADNNIGPEIVKHLRGSAMDVLWVGDAPELQCRDDTFHYRKAAELKRYLLTYDMHFWNDRNFPIKESPGVIILAIRDASVAKLLPVILRKAIDAIPEPGPKYLYGKKIKITTKGATVKELDRDSQKVSDEFLSLEWTS